MTRRLRQWRVVRLLRRRRRSLAALAISLTVFAALLAVRSGPPATRPVAVVARDLPAGHTVTESDVSVVAWPEAAVPDGTLADPRGQVLSSPLRRGEPITDVRVSPLPAVRAGGVARPAAGRVAMVVRIADPASAGLLRRGQTVDVLAADPQSSQAVSASVVVSGAVVLDLAVPSGTTATGAAGGAGTGAQGTLLGLASGGASITDPSGTGAGLEGGQSSVVVVAVTGSQAARLAAAQAVRILTVIGHLDP